MSTPQTLNPYASFLAGQNPQIVMDATPARLSRIACALTPEQLDTPRAPDKWSPRQILAHLADCELAFSFRLRQTLGGAAHGATPLLQPFDQDVWAQRYAAYTAPAALDLFTAARAWNLALLAACQPGDFHRPAQHPERGLLTFQIIVETIAGHDLNHLSQLETL